MGGGVTPADRWDEAVRRFVGMTPEEMDDLHACTPDDEAWMLLAVDALDQAGIDVQRVRLVER
jgi:hypothetical protein